jgi:hypothetical protein
LFVEKLYGIDKLILRSSTPLVAVTECNQEIKYLIFIYGRGFAIGKTRKKKDKPIPVVFNSVIGVIF